MKKQKMDKLQDIKNLLEIRTNEIENSINKKLESELKKSENKIIKFLEEKSYQSLENIETYVSQFLEKDSKTFWRKWRCEWIWNAIHK